LREEMRFEIRRIHDEFRITTVYVTHDQAEAMVTSDRIAVMNLGCVEQIDDPFTVYNHPKTRFVAGFIGRTNLLSGAIRGDDIDFDGFSVRASLLPKSEAGGSELVFSIRPQNIRLHADRAETDNARVWLPGRVLDRAYLGDYWDYVIAPGQSKRPIRASSPPAQVFERDQQVWLEIDPALVAPIPGH